MTQIISKQRNGKDYIVVTNYSDKSEVNRAMNALYGKGNVKLLWAKRGERHYIQTGCETRQ